MASALDQFLIATIRSRHPGGRVLDLPAGDGDLSRQLHDAGCEVVPAELFPEVLRWHGRAAVRADMTEPLPFADRSFDAIVCQEGIEHLENPGAFLRECRRVLRADGDLLLTTPNYLDLSCRISFLLSGLKGTRSELVNEETTLWGSQGDKRYHGHAFFLPYFQLRYLLRLAGFQKVELHGLRPIRRAKVLYWLYRPLAGWLLDRARGWRDQRQMSEPLYRELRAAALSQQLLCHRTIGVVARGTDERFSGTSSGAAGA